MGLRLRIEIFGDVEAALYELEERGLRDGAVLSGHSVHGTIVFLPLTGSSVKAVKRWYSQSYHGGDGELVSYFVR